MAYTTAGLTNGGRTAHYQIQYDDTLSAANALIAVCEADFALMSGWFDEIALTVRHTNHRANRARSLRQRGWGPPITLTPGNGSSITVVRYLLVSEVVEMFMLAQNKGWFGAGDEGSARRRALAFLRASS